VGWHGDREEDGPDFKPTDAPWQIPEIPSRRLLASRQETNMTKPPRSELDRRAFIRVGVAGGLALTTLPACGDGDGGGGMTEPPGPISAGNVANVAVGSLRALSGVILGRDADGLYAMTSVCTHQGCTVRVSGTTISCPCHGSAFDAVGAVTRGPAASPLRHFQVTVAADGSVTIDPTVPVAATTRTAVA
jgi:Rieske Fe-S protein